MTAMTIAMPMPGNHTKHGNADKADNGQPEFPLLDAEDATQVCEFKQANGRGDDDRSERATRQILQQVWVRTPEGARLRRRPRLR